MSKRLILFTIALLLILTFTLAQDSISKPPQQAGEVNNDRQSNHSNVFGVIYSFMVYLISLNAVCGVGIVLTTLKNKYYSISIQKKEAQQSLREEETPSQYLPQVPVVNVMIQPQSCMLQSSQPISVYYPHIQQQLPIQQENPEQQV